VPGIVANFIEPIERIFSTLRRNGVRMAEMRRTEAPKSVLSPAVLLGPPS